MQSYSIAKIYDNLNFTNDWNDHKHFLWLTSKKYWLVNAIKDNKKLCWWWNKFFDWEYIEKFIKSAIKIWAAKGFFYDSNRCVISIEPYFFFVCGNISSQLNSQLIWDGKEEEEGEDFFYVCAQVQFTLINHNFLCFHLPSFKLFFCWCWPNKWTWREI